MKRKGQIRNSKQVSSGLPLKANILNKIAIKPSLQDLEVFSSNTSTTEIS